MSIRKQHTTKGKRSNKSMIRTTNTKNIKQPIIITNKFKRWFGDWENDPEHSSKITDKYGRPLVVFHNPEF